MATLQAQHVWLPSGDAQRGTLLTCTPAGSTYVFRAAVQDDRLRAIDQVQLQAGERRLQQAAEVCMANRGGRDWVEGKQSMLSERGAGQLDSCHGAAGSCGDRQLGGSPVWQ